MKNCIFLLTSECFEVRIDIILTKNLIQRKNSDLKQRHTVIRLRKKLFEELKQTIYGMISASDC